MQPPVRNSHHTITSHLPKQATVESCAGDTRQRGQGFAKVVRGAFRAIVIAFIAAFWLLWIAGAIYRMSEDRHMEREAQRMAEEYNRSIKEMEASIARMRQTQREIQP